MPISRVPRPASRVSALLLTLVSPVLARAQDDTGVVGGAEPSMDGRGIPPSPWLISAPTGPSLYTLSSTTEDPYLATPNLHPDHGPHALALVDHAVSCVGTNPDCPTRGLAHLSFDLPTEGSFTFRRVRSGYNPDGSYTWVGSSIHGHSGSVIVTFALAHVSADLHVDGEQYIVRPDGWGGHYVQWVALSPNANSGDDEEPARPAGEEGDTAEIYDNDEDLEGWTQPEPPPASNPWIGLPKSGPATAVTIFDSGVPEERFTIDVMVAYSQDAGDDLGGHAGAIAYANNRVWETKKIWENSGITEYIPRLVAVIPVDDRQRDPVTGVLVTNGPPNNPYVRVDNANWDNLVGPGSAVSDHYRLAREGKLAMEGYGAESGTYVRVSDMRDYVGADVVAMLNQHMGGCGCIGLSPVPDINPRTEDIAYFGVLTGPNASTQWTFSHELGHSLGVSHVGSNGKPSGFQRLWSDYSSPQLSQLPGSGFTDLMRSGSAAGCRVPAFSSESWWWHVNLSLSTPCQHDPWEDLFNESPALFFNPEITLKLTNGNDPRRPARHPAPGHGPRP
jgi:hypothetical protein